MAQRHKKIAVKTIKLRGKLWPDLNTDNLWDRHEYDGFTTVPRTLPIVMNIIDDLTKGKPASKTYLALWSRAFDEMYISLQGAENLAFEAGFNGQRAVRTWNERMIELERLGFILTAGGARGKLSHAVILNPHFVIRRLHEKGTSGLTKAAYNTLLERAIDIGAKDMDQDLPSLEKTKVEPISKEQEKLFSEKTQA